MSGHPPRPLAIDLFAGLLGWSAGLVAAGWRVIAIDVEDSSARLEHVEFVIQDVLTLDGRQFRGKVGLIVASPPCPEFSRHMMPWTKRRNPPPPDLALWRAAERIADEAGAPLILENVREAQKWVRPAQWHCGAYYLWGQIPALMPTVTYRKKESRTSGAAAERAKIPFDIADYIGRCFLGAS